MKATTMPKINKRMTATNKAPPKTVKSHLVWRAKRVRAKQITAVKPAAITTSSALNCAAQHPSIKLSAMVKIPKKMKFIGALRRTEPQHAIQIRQTNMTPKDA